MLLSSQHAIVIYYLTGQFKMNRDDTIFTIVSVATNCSEGSVRLVGGELPNEGIVEICTINEWGSICDDGWDRPEARVVCRQLGYEDTADSIPYHLAHYGATLTPIHLDDLDCNGTESELLQCSHAGVGVHNCDRSEDAGVLCIGEWTCAETQVVFNSAEYGNT